MKIHQSEIEAGAKAYCQNSLENGVKAIVWHHAIEAALEAAYRVRKERKKQKRGDKASVGGIDRTPSDFWVNHSTHAEELAAIKRAEAICKLAAQYADDLTSIPIVPVRKTDT